MSVCSDLPPILDSLVILGTLSACGSRAAHLAHVSPLGYAIHKSWFAFLKLHGAQRRGEREGVKHLDKDYSQRVALFFSNEK